jgi:hypothetical protein
MRSSASVAALPLMNVLLTVKERDAPGQRTMLETWIAGTERVVATSTRDDLAAALLEVRRDDPTDHRREESDRGPQQPALTHRSTRQTIGWRSMTQNNGAIDDQFGAEQLDEEVTGLDDAVTSDAVFPER